MIYGLYNSNEYNIYLADQNDPALNKLWGILDLCKAAQIQMLGEFTLQTPLIVPLAVVTWITANLQFTVTSDTLPNQMRRITKIKMD